MLVGQTFFIEMLAALFDDGLGFAVAVHLMTGEAMMAAEEVEVETDTQEGNRSGAEIYNLEAKIRDKAA